MGAILGTFLSICQDKLAFRLGSRVRTPESRLYSACVMSALMPAGLFWFGWTSYPSIPWIVPTLAVGCATMGILSIYLAVFNYLADTYHRYASSAIAAQSFCKTPLFFSRHAFLNSLDRFVLTLYRSQHARWRVSTGDSDHVQESWIPCSLKLTGRYCKFHKSSTMRSILTSFRVLL